MATINIDVKCDLNKPVVVRHLDGMVFSQDVKANRIRVSAFRDGSPVDLSSGSVSANIIRADGATVVQTGTIEENVCSVVLPSSAYAVPGAIAIFVKHTSSGTTSTIAAITGYVYKSTTDTIVDPGTVVPNINELLALIDDCEDAAAACIAATAAFDIYFTPTNLAENASFTGYYYVDYRDGSNTAGSPYKASSMIDISGHETILYTRVYTSNSTAYAGIAFYDENQTFIANSGISAVFNQSANSYKLATASVPTGAKYIRLTGFRSSTTKLNVFDYDEYYSKVPAHLEKHDAEITNINNDIQKTNTRIDGIGLKEPITNVMTFRRGYWNQSNNFKTTDLFRVGCPTPITFNKTVHICALNGFAMYGFRNNVFFSNVATLLVPANTELKLYIRREWEDETETADVNEFTSGIYILDYNPSSEYDLNLDTFAGIEMFRTAGFIGDSYTATRLGHSWVDIVQNTTGVVCTKFAKSGADAGTFRTSTTYGLPALLADTKKDLYWFAMGINDGDKVDSNSAYLGSSEDLTGDYANYPNTFWGNTGCIIESIQAFAPKAKIVLYKPIFKSIIRTLAGRSATQNGIKLVRDAIGEIAEHYSLPCMDALDDVLFQTNWYSSSMDSAVSEGTHPSVMLYPAIAKANMRLFAKCIMRNGTYFRDVKYD